MLLVGIESLADVQKSCILRKIRFFVVLSITKKINACYFS